MGKNLIITFCLVFMLSVTIPGLSTELSVNFSTNVNTPEGGQLNIDISPNPTLYQPGHTYKFNIVFKAVTFGSNQTNFNTIYVQLRLLSSNGIINSDHIGPYEIDTLGTKISVSLHLVIPSTSQLGLSKGQSITTEFQYKVDFRAGSNSDIGSSESTGWTSTGQMVIEAPSNPSSGGFILLCLFVVSMSIIFTILYVAISKSKQTDQPINPLNPISENESNQFHLKTTICENCGGRLDASDRFCVNCGQIIKDY